MTILLALTVTLLALAPIVIADNPEAACPGKFNLQPCLTTNGTLGACFGFLPPCAKGFECKPYYSCDGTQKPLTNQCSQEGAACVVGELKASVLGSCVVSSPCPTGQPSCPVSLSCVTPSTAPADTFAESVTGGTVPVPTIIQQDPDRVQACQGKSQDAACTINKKPGKCSFQGPPSQRKRVPFLLQCFESSSITDSSICKDKKAGDSCGDRAQCVAKEGALACSTTDDAPNPNAGSAMIVSLMPIVVAAFLAI